MSIDRVISHMTTIAELSATTANHPIHKRALLDMYFAASPEILTVDADIQPAVVGDLACEWVIAENADINRRILYVHGGSWMAGSSISHRPLTARLAKACGCAVLAINYRLAPEFPFPNGLEDIIHGLQWLRNHSPTGEQAAEQMFLIGDSAGGNLSLAAMLALAEEPKNLPDACVLLSPATDLNYERKGFGSVCDNDPIISELVLPYIVAKYVQEQGDLKNPLISPIHGDLKSLPATLVQVGEREILLEDSVNFVEAAKAQGNEHIQLSRWPDMPHVFQGFAPILPEANQALEEINEFLRQI